MSDFARAQLLKYGWTEGKGLGKNENGIAEALKPKLKFDTSGVGHKDLDFEWWDSVYDRALKNIVLDKKSDEVSIKVAKENAFNISSSKSGLEVSKKKHLLHYGKFLKTSTLQDGNMIRDSTCEVIEDSTKDNPTIVKMSDEELFKACGGRTAHKGARHGLTLNGKLARIAKQEKQLLAAKFLKSDEDNSQSSKVKQKKKKKRKKTMEVENCTSVIKDEHILDDDDSLVLPPPTQTNEDYKSSKKTSKKVKRKIHNLTHQLTKSCMIQDDSMENDEQTQKTKNKCKKKKEKRKRDQESTDSNANDIQLDDDVPMEPRPKKLRKNYVDLSESTSAVEQNNECLENINHLGTVKSRCKKDKSHHSSKDHKYNHCVNTEVQRLNAKITLKKTKALRRKEKKKLEKLSESLLAVSLNVNSTEENVTNIRKKSKSSNKKHKKNKTK